MSFNLGDLLYLNKSHYQYAEAVFTSERQRNGGKGEKRGAGGNDEEERERKREIRRERGRCKMVSDRNEKQRKRGGGVRRYDNRSTTELNQFPFLTSPRPADDLRKQRGSPCSSSSFSSSN